MWVIRTHLINVLVSEVCETGVAQGVSLSSPTTGLEWGTHPKENPMMVHCNSCSREISREAKICPHCGQPDPYTDVDARLDVSIYKKIEREGNREMWICLSSCIICTLWGFVLGGGGAWGFIGAVIGFTASAFLSIAIIKVVGWFI
jgi:Zn finger protein HypA/HybF involved in hydrogenase expression